MMIKLRQKLFILYSFQALLDPKRSVKTVSASEAAATGLIKGAHVAPETSASAADKLEAAKRAAAKINLKNTPKGKVSINPSLHWFRAL